MEEQKLAEEYLILKTVTGSNLYGTETPESDLDYQGIFIPPKKYVYGLHKCEQVIVNEMHHGKKIEYTCYTLTKYIHLALANNPNIISLLYTPKERISFVNEYGQRLLDSRSMFLSKKAYHTFRGYAHAQRAKILTKNAEGKRLDLIQKYGYDVKFAMHLIRLLYEALEIFTEGQITYPCANRILLKTIRGGEKTLDWVLAEAVRLENLIDEAYARSSLQYGADTVKVEQLQMEMLEQFWSKN